MINLAFILGVIFLAILPWHAFLTTVLSHFLLGSNSDFLPKSYFFIAVWKEIFIVIFLLLFLYQWIKTKKFPLKIYQFDYFFLIFFLIAILSAIFLTKDVLVIIWGLKYDFSFLFLFYAIRGLPFSKRQQNKLLNIFLISGFSVIAWGLFLYYFLPPDFLLHLGYSSNISSYNAHKPLAAYQTITGEIPRFAATFSGPNQLGYFLTILATFFLPKTWYYFPQKSWKRWFLIGGFFLIIGALFLTFSRSAWLGFIVMILIFSLFHFKKFLKKIVIVIFSLSLLLATIFAYNPTFFQEKFFRTKSNSLHLYHTKTTFLQLFSHPFGVGLGKAGPATQKFPEKNVVYANKSDIDLILAREIDSKTRDHIWFYNDKDLKIRFKPLNFNELKNIPVLKKLPLSTQEKIFQLWENNHYETIAENWFIQIFQETGWGGGLFYCLFLFYLTQFFYNKISKDFFSESIFLSLISSFTIGLFLHVFADAATTLSLFFLLGISFSSSHHINH